MRTLSYGFALLDLVGELAFSAAQLKAHSLTTALSKDFEALLAETRLTLDREIELVAEVSIQGAKVMRADEALNLLTDQISRALLEATGGNRQAPLYQRFFGAERPSELKRPILGPQLEQMRDWVPTLSAATVPALKTLATTLAAAVKEADMAVEAQRQAERELVDFREIATCKALIDKVNAARKAAHGKLSEMVHTQVDANLPSTFAEQFFQRESRWTPPTREELVRSIARNEQLGAKLKQQLKELEEREAAVLKRRQEAEAATLRTDLQAAEKRAAEEQANISTLKSKLDRVSPPAPAPAPPV